MYIRTENTEPKHEVNRTKPELHMANCHGSQIRSHSPARRFQRSSARHHRKASSTRRGVLHLPRRLREWRPFHPDRPGRLLPVLRRAAQRHGGWNTGDVRAVCRGRECGEKAQELQGCPAPRPACSPRRGRLAVSMP